MYDLYRHFSYRLETSVVANLHNFIQRNRMPFFLLRRQEYYPNRQQKRKLLINGLLWISLKTKVLLLEVYFRLTRSGSYVLFIILVRIFFSNVALIGDTQVAQENFFKWIISSTPRPVKNFCWFQMYSHFWFDAPASRLATYYAKGGAPVYLYSFDHVSENFDYDRKVFKRYLNVSLKFPQLWFSGLLIVTGIINIIVVIIT